MERVREIVLISGISLLASVEEKEDEYILHYPYVVALTPPSNVTLLPVTKLTQNPIRISVRKELVLTAQDVPPDVALNYSRARSSLEIGKGIKEH